jgi:hypothetical protein
MPAAPLPAALASSSPAEVQGALQQFSASHPELANYLPAGGDIADLQSLVGQLVDLPPQALEAFAASGGLDQVETLVDQTLGTANDTDGLSSLGGPLESEFGDLLGAGGGFGEPATNPLGDFASLLAPTGSIGDLPDVLTTGSSGEFGDLSAVQYSDLGITPPEGEYVTYQPPEFDLATALPDPAVASGDDFAMPTTSDFLPETAPAEPTNDAFEPAMSNEALEDHAAFAGSNDPNDAYDQ